MRHLYFLLLSGVPRVGLKAQRPKVKSENKANYLVSKLGDASAAPAASAASGSAPSRATTMRATATHEKLLGIFTLLNLDEFIVTNWRRRRSTRRNLGKRGL